MRPYFPYAQVEAGVLETAARLFKIEFRRSAAAGWHPAVSVFDVFDGGQPVGRFYLDMHPREGKDKWFSAAPIVTGVRGRALPEAALICNFPAGDDKDPGLLQYNDVVTFFHEFGHLMHAILGGQTEWAGLSGFATEGDFIEVPSQMLEEFFRDEKLLQAFARHYQTGEILPAETIRKMKLAGAFGRADWVRSQLYYTTLSLDLHDQDPAGLDLDRITKRLYREPATLDLARRQPHVCQLRPPDRLLVELLHLCVRQGHRAGLLRPVRSRTTCSAATPARATARPCWNRAGRSPAARWCATSSAATKSFQAFSEWLNEEFDRRVVSNRYLELASLNRLCVRARPGNPTRVLVVVAVVDRKRMWAWPSP